MIYTIIGELTAWTVAVSPEDLPTDLSELAVFAKRQLRLNEGEFIGGFLPIETATPIIGAVVITFYATVPVAGDYTLELYDSDLSGELLGRELLRVANTA